MQPSTSPMRPLRGALAFAIIVISASLVGSSAEADPPAGPLSVRLALRNSNGEGGCLLFNSERGFPKDPSAALQRVWCPIVRSEALCPFAPVPAGTYAIACFHDENKNGKLDTGLFGIPTEGTVASNGAKGFMGPPSFKDAKFAFSGSTAELRLKVNY